jgi:lycopene cyclase domain-containing protein
VTNIVLNVLVLVVLVAVSWRVLRRLRPGPLWVTVLVLCTLTLVFDTLMIAADLYVYAPDKILGVYLWGAPLEDFAYAIAAAVGIPVLWTVLGRRGDRARRRDRGPGAPAGGPEGATGGKGSV